MKTKIYAGTIALVVLAGLFMFGPRFNWGSPPEGPCESPRRHAITARWWANPAGLVQVRWYLDELSQGEDRVQAARWHETGTAQCGDKVTMFARPTGTVRLRCEMSVDGKVVAHREPANSPCDITHTVE